MWSCETSTQLTQTNKPIVLSGRSQRITSADHSTIRSVNGSCQSAQSSCKLPSRIDTDLLKAYSGTEQQERKNYANSLRRLDRLQRHAPSETRHDTYPDPGTGAWTGRRLRLSFFEPPQWFDKNTGCIKVAKDCESRPKNKSADRDNRTKHTQHGVRFSASRRDLKSRNVDSIYLNSKIMINKENEKVVGELNKWNQCRSTMSEKEVCSIGVKGIREIKITQYKKKSGGRPVTALPIYTRPMTSISYVKQRSQSRN